MVARVGRVDRDDRDMGQILALAERLASRPAPPPRSRLSGNSCGMPCLWIAIRLKLRGANGSPRIVVDPRREPRRPAGLLGQHEIARPAPRRGRRSAARAAPSSRPAAASSRSPSWWTTPSTSSLPFSSFFIGWAIQPSPPSSVRARMRSPTPSAAPLPLALDHPEPRRRARPPPSARAPPRRGRCRRRRRRAAPSPWAPRPSCGRRGPGALSISPSSAMSLSSALSAILSCALQPEGPRDLALARRLVGRLR